MDSGVRPFIACPPNKPKYSLPHVEHFNVPVLHQVSLSAASSRPLQFGAFCMPADLSIILILSDCERMKATSTSTHLQGASALPGQAIQSGSVLWSALGSRGGLLRVPVVACVVMGEGDSDQASDGAWTHSEF